MDELNKLGGIAHEYRKSVDAYERRTGRAGQSVDNLGSGEEREKFAKMDADLDAVERTIQSQYAMRKAAEDRVRELEARLAEPTLRAKPIGKSGAIEDRDGADISERWIRAACRGDQAELRDILTSTTGAGVPTDMERRIINKLQQANVLRSMCPVRTIDSKRTITVEGALPATAKVAEGGSIAADTAMDFGTAISVSFTKYVTRVKISNEMLEDGIGNSGIGSFADYVAEKAGLSLGLYTEQQYTLGDGTGDPQGIAANAGPITQVTDLAAAAITTVTGDNLIDTVHLVPPQYRSGPRFSWFISDTFLKTVRKIKVNSTDYVWKPSDNGGLAEGAPGTIYGVPYRIGKYVDTATTNGNVFAVVGNFDYFEIFDRSGMTSMADPYTNASTGYTNLYFYLRTDSRCTLAEAFAAITC